MHKKTSLEDDDEIVRLFRNADRIIFKLDRMSSNSGSSYLSGELERLQEKREKLLDYVTEQYNEILSQMSKEGEAISDNKLYFEHQVKIAEFHKKDNHLLEYKLDYLTKLSNSACDFING